MDTVGHDMLTMVSTVVRLRGSSTSDGEEREGSYAGAPPRFQCSPAAGRGTRGTPPPADCASR
jgi:hypothetical protein